MSRKDCFLQLLQTFLLATTSFRRESMVSTAITVAGIMASAQKLKEECVPGDLLKAVEEFVTYYDGEYRIAKGVPLGGSKIPQWIEYEAA